ncbi:hypothetical protein Fmac_030620 [Flemingia macrophylla]|uniref:LOB domain-containing protein n=1 Tax=Flemingia macrophylla TaxID=520843 RepID=A0ABD1KZP6_9FABA
MAMYLSNIFGCFSECSPESERYICDGNVCVLKKQKENIGKQTLSNGNKPKQSLRISFARKRCAACKNQRRRCPSDCIFAPYFPANDPQRFACVHRIYGGSNVGKMLQQIPPYLRDQVANTLYYEAQCRIQDPVYGCVGIISKLSQEINIEIALAQIQTQIDCHKLQVQQPKVELNLNVLPTIEAESNFDVLQGQNSSAPEYQFPWFN